MKLRGSTSQGAGRILIVDCKCTTKGFQMAWLFKRDEVLTGGCDRGVTVEGDFLSRQDGARAEGCGVY